MCGVKTEIDECDSIKGNVFNRMAHTMGEQSLYVYMYGILKRNYVLPGCAVLWSNIGADPTPLLPAGVLKCEEINYSHRPKLDNAFVYCAADTSR